MSKTGFCTYICVFPSPPPPPPPHSVCSVCLSLSLCLCLSVSLSLSLCDRWNNVWTCFTCLSLVIFFLVCMDTNGFSNSDFENMTGTAGGSMPVGNTVGSRWPDSIYQQHHDSAVTSTCSGIYICFTVVSHRTFTAKMVICSAVIISVCWVGCNL